jgi:hypothetical protein
MEEVRPMTIPKIATDAAAELLELAAKNPEAVAKLGEAVFNVAHAKDPLEAAKRAAAATASEEASEEALKRILGRSK